METKKEFTNILISCLPDERGDMLKKLIGTLSESYNERWIVDKAPSSMEDIVKLLAVLEIKMKQVEKALIDLSATGFEINTKKIEDVLNMRDKHLFEAIGVMQKQINTIEQVLSYGIIKKIESKEPKKKLIIKKKPIEFAEIKGTITPRILKYLQGNDKKEFTSSQLAKIIYGKISRNTKTRITQTLKQHTNLVDAEKRGRELYYQWNPTPKRVM